MDDQSDNPTSLKDLFATAEEARTSLLNTPHPPNSPTHQETVQTAVSTYQNCLSLISSLSLFSPNESLDDLSTSSLPYLLTHHHLAELTQKLPSTSPSARKALLTQARDHYERYLHLLDNYDLLSAPHKALLTRYAEAPTTFAIASASDPSSKRDAKIASFKAEKELRSKLDFLRRRPEYALRGDEDAIRQTHLANLAYTTHTTFQSLEGLNREWDILAQAPEPLRPHTETQAEEDARRRSRANEDGYSERLDRPLRRLGGGMSGPLLTKEGKPLQPFTLVGNRQELAKGVFRPGHNLPTMSIDEYLEEERRRGGIIEGGGEASGIRPEPDEDDYEKADAETYKARAWDEFTESNAKGSGNTLNRG
ncbi:hypothetical protein OQA88_12883 [Cercophora sp. LCS_1]